MAAFVLYSVFSLWLALLGNLSRERPPHSLLTLRSDFRTVLPSPIPLRNSDQQRSIAPQRLSDSFLQTKSTLVAILPELSCSNPEGSVVLFTIRFVPTCCDGVLAPYSSRDPPSA
jgi:hypothetical protein